MSAAEPLDVGETDSTGSCNVRLILIFEMGCRRRGRIFGVFGDVKRRRAVGWFGWLLLLIQQYCRRSFGVTNVTAALFGVEVIGPNPSFGAWVSWACHSDQIVGRAFLGGDAPVTRVSYPH